MGARVELEELAMKALVYQIAEGHTVEDLTEEVRMCPSWPCMHPGDCSKGDCSGRLGLLRDDFESALCMRLRLARIGRCRSHALLSQQLAARGAHSSAVR